MNNLINHWAKTIIQESQRENPDDYKADKLDMQADDYEEEMKAREELDKEEKEAEKKAKVDEFMTPDEILAQHKAKEDAIKRAEDAKIKSVVIDELYDGYVAGQITFASGKKENFEQEISEDEIKDMFDKLSKKVVGKNVELTFDDAAMAIVRARLGDETTDWLLGPAKVDIEEWAFDDDVDPEMVNRKYDQDWARVNGMYGDEDDSGTDSDIYNSADGMSDY